MVRIPEDAKPNEFAIQKPVLVEEHHASGVHTERCTPSPRCGAHRCRGLYRLHHRTTGLQKQNFLGLRSGKLLVSASSLTSLREVPPEIVINHLLCLTVYTAVRFRALQPHRYLASESDEWGHRHLI